MLRPFLSRAHLGIFLLLAATPSPAQQRVSIRVSAQATEGALKPVWSFFGYDEPNYTYQHNGKKLLAELSALSPSPVYMRTHNLLTSGDGAPGLKWGATNAYTEDASGHSVYDWSILDRIFDSYRDAGVKPLVEVGFMPKALSIKPEPYRHSWPAGTLWTGWAYPPKDYEKWSELVYQWVRHSIDRYGKDEVESWYWEVWNEPNIGYWQGTAEEYYKLYDYTADAVKRAFAKARVGGPASTGPGNAKAAEFLRNFLAHCARGTNYTTARKGAPLDFISFHAKGSTQIANGQIEMGVRRHLENISKGFEIVASFPELRELPVILTESDPEGCAACSVQFYPQNAYRNGPLYASYTAGVLRNILDLAERYKVNLEGVVTWAFEFENQPYFVGFRTLATNGIDKPVLNVFRMLGLIGGERLKIESTGSLSLDSILRAGARAQPDIDAMATRQDHKVSILVWNYQDDDIPGPAANIELVVEALPSPAQRLLMQHYRIDEKTSNSYSAWKEMGSPQKLSAEQYARLEAAGQLQLPTSPQWLIPQGGRIRLVFALPRQAVSLVQLTW